MHSVNGVAKQRLLSNFMHTKCLFQLKQFIHFGLKLICNFHSVIKKYQHTNIQQQQQQQAEVAKERKFNST